MAPKISIVIPVYNGQSYLDRTIRSIHAQTFQDYEVIFVNDESADASLTALKLAAEQDNRFTVVSQKHAGAGTARNLGLSLAKSEYVLFSDCDDIYAPDFLEKLYRTAEANQADIVACNFTGITTRGNEMKQTGIHTEWIPQNRQVFSYRDCPVNILRIAGPMVWNKLYRKAFIDEHNLRFDALLTCNDLSFVLVSLAAAERIACLKEHPVYITFPRQNNPKRTEDVTAAVTSAAAQLRALPHSQEIQNAIRKFIVETYIASLKRDISDFSSDDAARFYSEIHTIFNQQDFLLMKPEEIRNDQLYREFLTVQKHAYETMKALIRKRLIISLTTYPRRIHAVAQVIESLCVQTRKPSEIVLWLAESQFPEKELELPEELLRLVARKCLTIRWCDDLKSHKKYFYAFQEYPDDLVVTVDDDVIYSPTTLDTLYKSYLLYPEAVSTMRGHLILVSEENEMLPYNKWIQETDLCAHKPSMQLFATGVAGILYSPNLFRREFFDKDAIMLCCPLADDLWLKAMQLASDVPVVVAGPRDVLQYIPGTQETALCNVNVKQGQNDVQLRQIIQWMDNTFQHGLFMHKLLKTDVGVKILGMEAVSGLVDAERMQARHRFLTAQRKISAVETALSDTKSALNKAEHDLRNMECSVETLTQEKKQIETQLEEAQLQGKKTEAQLRKTKEKLVESEKSKPVREQLKLTGKKLRQQKGGPMSAVKFLIYCLAWIPEQMLEVMMYYLHNGAKQTLRQIYRKLFRRKQ